MELVRGVPFRMDPIPAGGVRVAIEGTDDSLPSSRVHDRVVLSVGMEPAEDAAALGRLMGLAADGGGFHRATADNVLVAGTCSRPQTIPECIGEAGAVAGRLMRLATAARGNG